MASNLNYIQATEPMAGAGGTYTDTLNRALRNALTLSGYNPDANQFPGFYGPAYNVVAYGAVKTLKDATSVAANTTAFNNAINAANAAGGGTVAVPAGIYYATDIIHKSNVHVRAIGGTAVIKRPDNTANFTRLWYVGRGSTTQVSNVTLEDIIFDGNIANQLNSGTDYTAGTDTIAFNSSYQQNHSLFLGFESGYTGVGCDNIRLISVRFNGSQGDGVAINQFATNVTLLGASGRACARGSFDLFGGASTVKLAACHFDDWLHIENDVPSGSTPSYCEVIGTYAANLTVLGSIANGPANTLRIHMVGCRIDAGPHFEQVGGIVSGTTFNVGTGAGTTTHRIIQNEKLRFEGCKIVGTTALTSGALMSFEPANGTTANQDVTFNHCEIGALGGTKAVSGAQEISSFHAPGSKIRFQGCHFTNLQYGLLMRLNGNWRVFGNTFDTVATPYYIHQSGGASIESLVAKDNAYINCDNYIYFADNQACIGPQITLYDRQWENASVNFPPITSAFGTSAILVRDRREFFAKTLQFTGAIPPIGPTATAVATGGAFPAGTYYWKVTALAPGETGPSVEVSAAIALNGSATIQWSAVAGATAYRIYRGNTAGGENVYYAVGNVTSFTDVYGANAGGTPPAQATCPMAWAGAKVTITDSANAGDKAFWYKTGNNLDTTVAAGRSFLSVALA